MKRRRSTKAKSTTGQPTPKSLGVRYTEILKLRQAISRTQSGVKIQSEFHAPQDSKQNRAFPYH